MLRSLRLRRLCLFVVTAALLQSCDPVSPDPDPDPTAGEPPSILAIQTDPSLGMDTVTPVIFEAQVASRSTPPLDYLWDFGDGSPASQSSEPNHTFSVAGSYVVSLTVENAHGADSKSIRVRVDAPDSDLYFWTDTPVFGPMQVTVNGVTQSITRWYPQYPGCGRYPGVAAFVDLPRGTYRYFASSASGRTWSGSVTLSEHCHPVALR